MAKFDVKVGDEFEIAGVEIEDIGIVERLAELDERRRVSKQQAFIVCAVLVAFGVALCISAWLGWKDGTYDEFTRVMAGGGPWAGWVIGRYFKKG